MKDIIESIIPRPKKYRLLDNDKRTIRRDYVLKCSNFNVSKIFNERLNEMLGFSLYVNPMSSNAKLSFNLVDGYDKEEYKLTINNNIEIEASTERGLLYGAYTLLQLVDISRNNMPQCEIIDKPAFNYRGFYHDVTRGKMPTLESLKKLIAKASYYKYNQFQIYIEHTFMFEGMEQTWFDKAPLSPDDILELDAYASSLNVELVPTLAIFGHMYEILRTEKYKDLCEYIEPDRDEFNFIDRMRYHTINPFDEKSFELISNMLEQFIPLFKSNKFNIGCDETFYLCKGKNKDRVKNEEQRFEIYLSFVKKIADFVKAHGKEVMIWDDIVLNSGDPAISPDDYIYMDWDYGANPSEENREKISKKPKACVCAGTAAWNRLINNYDQLFANCDNLCHLAKKYGIEGYYITNWGDYGDIAKTSLVEIPMAYAASVAWQGDAVKNKIKFMKDLSWLMVHDEELLPLLLDIAKYHIITYRELNFVLYENFIADYNLEEQIMDITRQQENIDYSKLSIIEEILYSKLSTVEDKDFILDLLNIIDGIRVFNSFKLTTYTYDGSYDKLCSWWYEYMEQHLKCCKPGELSRNTDVIRKLIQKFKPSEK